MAKFLRTAPFPLVRIVIRIWKTSSRTWLSLSLGRCQRKCHPGVIFRSLLGKEPWLWGACDMYKSESGRIIELLEVISRCIICA